MIRSFRAVVDAGALLALLAGCGLFTEEPTPSCPRAKILSDARTVQLYRDGEGRDPTDVKYEVAITSLTGECEYDFDDGRSTITAVFTLGIEARRGPAGDSDTLDVPYFVAVVDPERNIRAKQIFRPTLVFAASGIRTGTLEEVEQVIPVATGFAGPDYEIFVGLQLDRDQLDEQLKQKR